MFSSLDKVSPIVVAYTTALIIKNETTILPKLMSKISHGFDSRDLSDDNSFMTKTAKI